MLWSAVGRRSVALIANGSPVWRVAFVTSFVYSINLKIVDCLRQIKDLIGRQDQNHFFCCIQGVIDRSIDDVWLQHMLSHRQCFVNVVWIKQFVWVGQVVFWRWKLDRYFWAALSQLIQLNRVLHFLLNLTFAGLAVFLSMPCRFERFPDTWKVNHWSEMGRKQKSLILRL